MHGSNAITRNTFRGDPRPSLWRWIAEAGRYQVERHV